MYDNRLGAAPPTKLVSGPFSPGFAGACVGRPVREMTVRIIALTDGPIATLADARELPPGEIGEIIVHGPVVTQAYDALPEATAAAKIAAASSQPQTPNSQPQTSPPAALRAPWHRMGDTGYLDADGRLWFCGRKAERVEIANGVLCTEPCEQVFRAHPAVARCALVGLGPRGAQTPAIVVQPAPGAPLARRPAAFAAELRALALRHPHTAPITRFYFHPAFPVDVRHNAKIHRLTLAKWAATAKGHDIP